VRGISQWYGGGLGRCARTGRGGGQTARQRRARPTVSSDATRGRDGLQYALVSVLPRENADPDAKGGGRHAARRARGRAHRSGRRDVAARHRP
jgi:hypothetical protein